MEQNEKLCFDDILLEPRYSELDSRTSPDISTKIGYVTLKIPIISSPMDSITGKEMLLTMDRLGGLGILTRYLGLDDGIHQQVSEIKWAISNGAKNVGCALGIRPGIDVQMILDAGCNVVCLDVAHGDHAMMYDALKKIDKLRGRYKFTLMAGNVCTKQAAVKFAEHSVDAIKVGIGPGAACTTRDVTGFGVPQLSAVIDCVSAIHDSLNKFHHKPCIIADGGIRKTGDMVKALWAGASACMVGYMLAGTSATPDLGGSKMYRGMSSRSVSGRDDIAPEGIEFTVDYRGSTDAKLDEYAKGIRSGFAMGGANNIAELRKCTFVRVSPLSMKETQPVSH